MEALAFLFPFLLLGVAVIFIAFSGGPGPARESYLTSGNGVLRFTVPILYVALGLVVPALILSGRGEAAGGVGALQDEALSETADRGKTLFRQQCASCHTLAAVNAKGLTGPSLDEIGEVTRERIVNAIDLGGTGQDRMPPDLLEGEEAAAVAEYVAAVAGGE